MSGPSHWHHRPISISRCCLTSTANPMVDIRQSYGCLIPMTVFLKCKYGPQISDVTQSSHDLCWHNDNWESFHKSFKSSWLKSCENSFPSTFNSTDPIMSQFCTCHDSWAVMACAKIVTWIDHYPSHHIKIYFWKILYYKLMNPLWNGSQGTSMRSRTWQKRCRPNRYIIHQMTPKGIYIQLSIPH